MRDYHTEDNIRVGGIVKEFRLTSGLSRVELARLAGCSYKSIAAFERAERACTPSMRRKIVDALGVPLAIFTSDDMRNDHLNRLRCEPRPQESSAA